MTILSGSLNLPGIKSKLFVHFFYVEDGASDAECRYGVRNS